MQPRRVFTVEGANSLIPLLEGVLERIEACKAEIDRRHGQMQVLDVLWGTSLLDAENPDHAEATEHRTAIRTAAREIEKLVEEEILERGIRFPQGGLEHGLMDFPTTLDGRWIYLCWRRGEAAVAAWHEVHAGYAGRQPLTTEHEARMGR